MQLCVYRGVKRRLQNASRIAAARDEGASFLVGVTSPRILAQNLSDITVLTCTRGAVNYMSLVTGRNVHGFQEIRRRGLCRLQKGATSVTIETK